MKVVINTCYGGFGLSHEAMLRYAELKGITLYPEEDTFGLINYWTTPEAAKMKISYEGNWRDLPPETRQEFNRIWNEENLYDRDIPRTDPALIQTIQELGDKASGRHAKLKIVDIPDDILWEIKEYDGMEHIAESHRSWS